jgi:peptidyl-prolyl cis-trans isomerase B (cyclophilin B)
MYRKITLSMLYTLLFITLGCFEDKKDIHKEDMVEPVKKQGETQMRIKTIHGDILIKFFPQVAPNTVNRIKELIKEGFYNGLTFHRVIPGFVAQGGDPKGNGTGGSGTKLKAEFSKLKHKKGTVAMARSSDPDSADSQFYISYGPQPHLDGKYTIFGEVTEGMDAAEKLKIGDKMILVTLE